MSYLMRVESILNNPNCAYNRNNLLNILDELKRNYRFEDDDEFELIRVKKEVESLDYYNHYTHEVDWSKKHSFLSATQEVYRILSYYELR